jgi:ERCC4-type nuclease
MAKVITLDTRENKDSFIAYLTDAANVRDYSIYLEALPFGDIKFENIIVERKEINDFCSSVCGNRMYEQIAQMKANLDYASIIALSGTYNNLWKNNKDKIPVLNGALQQIMAWGIPVMHCQSDEELVDRVLTLFEYAKPIDVPIKHVTKDTQISLFTALPKIGRKNAKKIQKKYDNMVKLCTIPQEELQEVLGPVKGKDVFNALRNI